MSYKLKEIIYNADGYYPVFENDENDDNNDNNKKYKINNIEQKKDIEKKDIESKIKIVFNKNLDYSIENIKDYLHR